MEIENRIKKENQVNIKASNNNLFFENQTKWLTTKEAATYLRKINLFGKPSENAIHKLVARGRIRKRKFSGRLYFNKNELDQLIEASREYQIRR